MTSTRSRRPRDNRQRLYIFWYHVPWLGVIAWSGWLVATNQPIFGYQVPDMLRIIPTAVVWYGALGGVMISLVGVHEHRYDWDQRFWSWYLSRPVVGAFVAIIAVLVFQSGILAVGLNPTSDETPNAPQDIFYYVLAFVVGYREESFRQLLKRVADVFLTSKDQAKPPQITEVEPDAATAGSIVAVRGSGFTGTQIVRFGGVEAEFKFASDAQLDVTVPIVTDTDAVDVTVGNASTSITQPDLFTVLPPEGELPPDS